MYDCLLQVGGSSTNVHTKVGESGIVEGKIEDLNQ